MKKYPKVFRIMVQHISNLLSNGLRKNKQNVFTLFLQHFYMFEIILKENVKHKKKPEC